MPTLADLGFVPHISSRYAYAMACAELRRLDEIGEGQPDDHVRQWAYYISFRHYRGRKYDHPPMPQSRQVRRAQIRKAA